MLIDVRNTYEHAIGHFVDSNGAKAQEPRMRAFSGPLHADSSSALRWEFAALGRSEVESPQPSGGRCVGSTSKKLERVWIRRSLHDVFLRRGTLTISGESMVVHPW